MNSCGDSLKDKDIIKNLTWNWHSDHSDKWCNNDTGLLFKYNKENNQWNVKFQI